MTVNELIVELQHLVAATDCGEVPAWTYDADGAWVEVTPEQIVGDCDDPADPQRITGVFFCSPEEVP
jgi:hypothetical protein